MWTVAFVVTQFQRKRLATKSPIGSCDRGPGRLTDDATRRDAGDRTGLKSKDERWPPARHGFNCCQLHNSRLAVRAEADRVIGGNKSRRPWM